MSTSSITAATQLLGLVRPPSFSIRVFIIISLVFFSLPQTTLGISYNQIIVSSAMFLIIFLCTMSDIRSMVQHVLMDRMLLVLVVFFLLSLLWSATPLATLVSLLKFCTATLGALYIASKCTLKSFFNYFIIFLFVSAVLSIAVGIILPQYTIHRGVAHSGSWMGIFGHKNAMGTICVLGITAMQVSLFSNPNRRMKVLSAVSLALYILLLILSASRTAIVVTALLTCSSLIYIVFRSLYGLHKSLFYSLVCWGVVICSGIGYLFLMNLDLIFSLMDRTPELTGRTEIWTVVQLYIQERLWFGYGMGGFWNSGYALEVWDTLNYPYLTSSHSGLYDFLLDFGVLGLMILAAHYFILLRACIRLSIRSRGRGIIMWFLIFILFIIVNNYTDSRFLNTTSVFWMLYVCSSLLIRKSLIRE